MRLERLCLLGAIGLVGCRGRAPEVERALADRIVAAALADGGAWEKLEWLTDRIGHRLSGSPQLEAAVEWAADTLRRDGHENVRTEPVVVSVWQRGEASAEIVSPVHAPMRVLALGNTPSTPPEGIEAEVMLVGGFEELERRRDEVRGKIVVFDQAMPPYDGSSHYGEAVRPRGEGPAKVSSLGGAAVLIRSVTARSLRSPHTGNTRWKNGESPIPAGALAVEDAALVRRLVERGEKVRVRFVSSARVVGEGESANVIAEIVGRERPEEIVVLGAHLDSWDVGQGAHDDGAGCVIVMQALSVLRKLELEPRRTLRVVLFTNEENGVAGARTYRREHQKEKHVAAVEADSGGFAPRGWSVAGPGKEEVVNALNTRIAPLVGGKLGRLHARVGEAGTDVEDLEKDGALVLGHSTDGSTYFDYHHSEADTLDKVDPKDLRKNVAVMALLVWWLAERDY